MAYIHDYYKKLFNDLHIATNDISYSDIIHEDFEFYKSYADLTHPQRLQIGGEKPKKIKYKYDEYTFTIYQRDDVKSISFSIDNKGNDESTEACMVLFIPYNDSYVYLQSISYYNDCSIPSMPKTQGGSLLLNATLNFIDDITSKYNLKYIQLRDTSNFTCHKDKKNTPVCNLYMLTRGDIWYGRYGFIPFDPNTKQMDIDGMVNYKLNQKLVKLVKVKHIDMYNYFIKASHQKNFKKYNEKIINGIVDAYKDRSIQDFFKDFINKYDERCDMFNAIYKDVMDEIGMVDLYGKVYFKVL